MQATICPRNEDIRAYELNARPRFSVAERGEGTRVEEIMDRYLAADFSERLDLWLSHRDMRSILRGLDDTPR